MTTQIFVKLPVYNDNDLSSDYAINLDLDSSSTSWDEMIATLEKHGFDKAYLESEDFEETLLSNARDFEGNKENEYAEWYYDQTTRFKRIAYGAKVKGEFSLDGHPEVVFTFSCDIDITDGESRSCEDFTELLEKEKAKRLAPYLIARLLYLDSWAVVAMNATDNHALKHVYRKIAEGIREYLFDNEGELPEAVGDFFSDYVSELSVEESDWSDEVWGRLDIFEKLFEASTLDMEREFYYWSKTSVDADRLKAAVNALKTYQTHVADVLNRSAQQNVANMTSSKKYHNKVVLDDLFNDVWDYILQLGVTKGLITVQEYEDMELEEAFGVNLFESPYEITDKGKEFLRSLGLSYFYAYHKDLDTPDNQIWILEEVDSDKEWVETREVEYALSTKIMKFLGQGPVNKHDFLSYLEDESRESGACDVNLQCVFYHPEA